MDQKFPTPKERELLMAAYHYINLHQQQFPDNEFLSKTLHVESPRVS
jgi:hypothetical protein